ncbi:MAG: hypothetical protein ACR2OZ_13830 [Verrucomicrobiales bacterium]
MSFSNHDVHYALEMTRVLHEPDRRIDSFGATQFEFFLVSELMDTIDQVRIRTGKIQAERPRIVRPEPYGDFTYEGFGEQARAFHDWLKEHVGDVAVLQYGFSFRKSDVQESLVHDQIAAVQDRLVRQAVSSGNPLSAVISGVDDTWEICLLKFTMEMIQKSSGINIFDFKRRGLL